MSEDDMVCEIVMNEATTDEISDVLAKSKTIAIIGLSPKEERPSNRVAKYLLDNGYEIFPVNPMHDEILGRRSYASVGDIPDEIDIVDIFRKPAAVPAIVSDAIEKGAKTIWMQERIVNNAAANEARDAGLAVVMDKCLLKEHMKWKH